MFEARFGQHNLNLHTANDTLANSHPTCGHAAKFSRLAAVSGRASRGHDQTVDAK